MNYTLSLFLDGFDKTDAQLDSLLSKVGQFSNFENFQIDKLIDQSGILKSGEQAGDNFTKGFSNKLKSFNLFDFWGKAVLKGQSDNSIKGLKESGGADLKKVLDLPDINSLAPKVEKMKIIFAGIATLFNPFVGARLLSDIIPKGGMSGGKGVSGAIFGAAGAAGYGEIFVVVKSLELVFKILVGSIRKTIEAYDDARKLYAKSLMSGLGLGFSAKRQNLADVLGVSEQEVIRFGAAWTYLNGRLQFASDTMAKNATPLAGVGWEFKILEKNLQAIWSTIASGLAPGFKQLISEFNDFLAALGKSQFLEVVAATIDVIFIGLNDVIGLIEIIVNSFTVGLRVISDAIAIMMIKAINLFEKARYGAFGGVTPLDDSAIRKDLVDSTTALWNEVANYGANFFGAKTNNVPAPQSFMKQLPASTWEKMGLMVGGGGNSTNDLIRKSNGFLQTISKAVTQDVPRGNQGFGMSPLVSNP